MDEILNKIRGRVAGSVAGRKDSQTFIRVPREVERILRREARKQDVYYSGIIRSILTEIAERIQAERDIELKV
jgi:hypothetical protein